MHEKSNSVWYLRNGDIEQVVACDRGTAMQLLGSMSGYIGELLPQMDPEGRLTEMASQHRGTVYTKRYDQPVTAWSARVN
jgi:hypothetical protein